MMAAVEVRQVKTQRELRSFVRFPWRVYVGDPSWVPPLISERMAYLDPARGPFYRLADVALFLARRGRESAGTIAAFVDRRQKGEPDVREGGFGFFEVVREYEVAARLLDTAGAWLRARGATLMRGPTSFSINEYPGVLIEGADCPPVMLEAHTPPYYKDFLEQYGMKRDHDLYAWRAFRRQIGEELEHLPPELGRVADVARRVANVRIRKLDMAAWDQEIATALALFNETLKDIDDFTPMSHDEFGHLAADQRLLCPPGGGDVPKSLRHRHLRVHGRDIPRHPPSSRALQIARLTAATGTDGTSCTAPPPGAARRG